MESQLERKAQMEKSCPFLIMLLFVTSLSWNLQSPKVTALRAGLGAVAHTTTISRGFQWRSTTQIVNVALDCTTNKLRHPRLHDPE